MSMIKELIGKKENDPSQRSFAVIVKNSVICDYNCTYCYTEEVNEIETMDLKTAEIMIEKIISHVGDRKLFFVWHGGEPLLSGLDFFYGVNEIMNRYKNIDFTNAIQTNASLVNQDLIEFLKKTKFKISTSLDGPEELHNLTRKDSKGNGTFQQTMKSINMLREANIDISCICVLNKHNVDKIEELYNFFKSNNLNFRLNPVVKAGNATVNYNSLAISPKEYGEAMCQLFDLWVNDENPVKIKNLITIVGNMLYNDVRGCDFQGRCLQSIISITPEGNIYPCGRFIGDTNFKVGNIIECNSLEEVFDSELFRKISTRDATTVPGCKNCDFAEICNGGCMITAHMGNSNIFDSDYYCAGKKMLFKHILEKLKDDSSVAS